MNWNDEQHDPLDDLLRKAAWPEPRADQLDRLAKKWRGTLRRRKIRNASLVAATIFPIAALAWSLGSWSQRRVLEIHQRAPIDQPIVAIDQPTPLTPALSPGEREIDQLVLEPTAYEQALAVLYRSQAAGKQTAVFSAKSTSGSPVTSAIEWLAENFQNRALGFAQELSAQAPNFEASLQGWYQRGLAAVNDEAVARTSSVDQLVGRVRSETSPQRQRLWMAAILRRGTIGSVNSFLELAGDPSISTVAFEAAKEADGRTIDKIFEAMQSSRVAIRQTAARVLGALNNPIVSQRLAQMAKASSGRREALIGLLSSSDPVARKFLSDAKHDIELAPSIRALAVRF
jgi:hypothetical protein